MNGKQLFDSFIKKRDDYARVLMTASQIEGPNIYKLLEQAEKEGKIIAITYPIDPEDGESEPLVILEKISQ